MGVLFLLKYRCRYSIMSIIIVSFRKAVCSPSNFNEFTSEFQKNLQLHFRKIGNIFKCLSGPHQLIVVFKISVIIRTIMEGRKALKYLIIYWGERKQIELLKPLGNLLFQPSVSWNLNSSNGEQSICTYVLWLLEVGGFSVHKINLSDWDINIHFSRVCHHQLFSANAFTVVSHSYMQYLIRKADKVYTYVHTFNSSTQKHDMNEKFPRLDVQWKYFF